MASRRERCVDNKDKESGGFEALRREKESSLFPVLFYEGWEREGDWRGERFWERERGVVRKNKVLTKIILKNSFGFTTVAKC